MAISDTSFFSAYQASMGTTYARGYEEVYNPVSTLPLYVNARQLFIANMSSSEVTTGLNVVNSHLSAENSYSASASGIVRTVLQSLNSFFNNTHGATTREYFNGLASTSRVAWQNSFKAAWQVANSQELIQQTGLATWNGVDFTIYPATSPITNIQNVATISTSQGTNLTLSGINLPITNFALPNDIIVISSDGSMPSVQNISLGTTVVGYANTNTLILSGNIGAGVSAYAFRPLTGTEYLEFRYGRFSATGAAATSILSDIVLSITLNNGVSTSVTLNTSSVGRTTIGAINNSNYKSTGISSILITSGSINGLGTQQGLEVWVKGTG